MEVESALDAIASGRNRASLGVGRFVGLAACEQSSSDPGFDYQSSIRARTLSGSLNSTGPRLRRVLDQDRALREGKAVGGAVLTANKWLVMGSIAAGTIMFPPAGAAAAIAMAGTQFALDASFDTLLDLYEADATETANKALAARLRQMREEEGVALEDLAGMPPQERRRRVLGSGISDRVSILEAKPEARAIVNNHLIQVLEDAVGSEIARAEFERRATAANVGALQDDVAQLGGLTLAMLETQEHVKTSLTRVQTELHQVQADVGQLTTRVSRNESRLDSVESDVRFLNDFVFGQLPPARQIEALKRGIFPEMSSAERAAAVHKIRIVERRQAIVEGIGDVLNAAGVFVQAAGRLGVDPDFVEKAGQVVRVGQAAFSAFTSFASGNYLGAVTALAGLLGGGPDAATVRHGQVMGRLSQLLRGQQAILTNQRHILDNQRRILESLCVIYEEVIRLGQTIQRVHASLMESLAKVRTEVLINRSILRDLVSEGLERAEYFRETRHEIDHSFRGGAFRSYEGLAQHFYEYSDTFHHGIRSIELALSRDEVAALFRLTTFAGDRIGTPSLDALAFIRAIYLPCLSFWREAVTAASIQPEVALKATLLPSRWITRGTRALPGGTTADSQEKLGRLGNEEPIESARFLLANLENLLSVTTLTWACNLVAELNVYFQLLMRPNDASIMEAEEVALSPRLSRRGRGLVRNCLPLLDLAIAQQALLSGDCLLEHLGKLLERHEPSALELLRENALLRRNWAVHCVREALARRRASAYHLEIALRTRTESRLLESFLDQPWEVRRVDPGPQAGDDSPRPHEAWVVVVGWEDVDPVMVPMPSPKDIIEGLHEHTPEMGLLLATKARVVDALADYDLVESLPEGDRAFALTMNLLGVVIS